VKYNLFVVACLFVVNGCASEEDSETKVLLDSLAPAVTYSTSENMHEIVKDNNPVIAVWIEIRNQNKFKKQEILDVFQHLGKLAHLRSLTLAGEALEDESLKLLPLLPNLEELCIDANKITDKGLKHLAGLTNLKKLQLSRTQVRGSGLLYLKGFSKLEWFQTVSTPLDDSAIPHIAANLDSALIAMK